MAATLPLCSWGERFLACAGLFLLLRRRPPRSLVAVALSLGVVGSLRISNALDRALSLDGYEGEVRLWAGGERRGDAFRARVRCADGRSAELWLRGEDSGLVPGVEGLARVRLWMPADMRNPDDRRRWRAGLAGGAILRGRIVDAEIRARRVRTPGIVTQLRAQLSEWLDFHLAGSSALWRALILAEREDFPAEFQRRLQRLGLSHLLALSGLHVGLLVGAALYLRPRRPPSMGLLVVLVAWVLLAHGGASLLRAAGMVGWMMLGRRLQRRCDAIDALAFVAWVECCLWPWRVAGVGWWLSYGATLALLRAQDFLRRLPRLPALALLSLVAQWGGAPWALASFGQWPWIAPLSNLGIGLLFAPFLLICFFALACAALVPWLAPACAALVKAGSHAFMWILFRAAAQAPAPLGHPGIAGVSWGLALAAWCCVLLPLGRLRWRLPAALACVLLPHLRLMAERAPEWWTLDVGQGDAGVYRSAAGKWLVVDVGPAFADYSAAEAVVAPFLRRRNARDVHLLLSHGHLDHYGGAGWLIRQGDVGHVYVARADSGRAWTRPLVAAASSSGATWVWLAAGDSLRLGDERLPVFWPPAATGGLHANDRSIVLCVGDADARLLLMGDAEQPAERAVLEGGKLPEIELLKLGHHGANTSTLAELLERIGAAEGLISCAAINRYGHPHPATLDRLRAYEVSAWRTDRQGAIHIRWSGPGYTVSALRPAAGGA